MNVSVASLVRARANSTSAGQARDDPFHLALVIEGGGMRGVVSGGMVTAIEKHGLLHCFDSIHGSSAGACAGAYLTAGQAAIGTSIYFEDINNSKFISLLRGLSGGPTMNANFLIDYVMQHSKPINTQAILSRPGFLHVVATSVEDGTAQVFSAWHKAEEFFETLRASILIPIIAGRSVALDGKSFVDGGMVQQVAIESALAKGATHVLVLMTRTADELERRTSPMMHRIERALLYRRYGSAIARAYDVRASRINATIAAISAGTIANGVTTACIVRPATAAKVGRLTKDARLLREAAQDGERAVEAFLGLSTLE